MASLIVHLLHVQPDAWRAKVRLALLDTRRPDGKGSVIAAAKRLECSAVTLRAWLAADPSLAQGLDVAGRGRPRKPVESKIKTERP